MPKGVYLHKKRTHSPHRRTPRPHCRKAPGTVSLTYLFNNYKSNSRRRGYAFEFGREEFLAIVKRDCYYCGSAPLRVSKRDFDSMLYNGIDRIDNSLGYVAGNCVPCCRRCNMMKGTMSVQQFFESIALILQFHKKILSSEHSLRDSDFSLNTQERIQ